MVGVGVAGSSGRCVGGDVPEWWGSVVAGIGRGALEGR